MRSNDDLAKMREEQAVLDTWRIYSRHVIADLLEACSVCGMVAEKSRLTRCGWCEDVYYCKAGACSHQHWLSAHPAVAFRNR